MNLPVNNIVGRLSPTSTARIGRRAASLAVAVSGEEDWSGSLVAGCIALVGGIAIAVMLNVGLTQLTATIFFMLLFAVLALISPQVAILSTCVFLAVMGDLRRLLIQDVSDSLDPVLLVGPVVAILLTSIAYFSGRLNQISRTSKLMRALMIVMILQIFNPLQGGLAVGIAGVLFYLIPVLWFWIGQAWGSGALVGTLLCWIVVPVCAAASVMGIHQAFYGYYPFELDALHRLGIYHANISGAEWRPWGFFTSSSEYTAYLSIGIVASIASLFAKQLRVTLLLIPFIAVALFVSGVRGPVAGVLVATILLWAMLSRSVGAWYMRLVLAAVVFISGFVWTLNEIQGMDLSPQLSSLVQHQSDGFLNIQDERKSSAQGHLMAGAEGVIFGLSNPLGRGLGSTTMAASKFGGSVRGTETDIGDAFMSMGVVGGCIYLALVVTVLKTTVREWRLTRSPVTLSVLGVLFVMLGRWMYGGQYATASLCWFCIGSMDCITRQSKIGSIKSISSCSHVARDPDQPAYRKLTRTI